MLEHPPIGWEQRVRPQSRLLVQADVWEATLLGLGQVAALLLVIIPLVLGTVSSGNQRASLRGLITVSIFVATEVATATVGVIRILTRRRLIALNKIEHQRRIVTRVDLP
jgi:galactitol-specific phosphotransferase system IIC component